MRCNECRDNLPEYSLDTLDEAQALAMREHLIACADCRAELAAFERLDELMAPVEQVSPDRDLWGGVSARIKPRQVAVAPKWFAPRWQQAMAAAAVVLALAVGGLMMQEKAPAFAPGSEMLAADYQEQQVIAEWSQPLADDASLGLMLASISVGESELQ